MDIRGSRYRRRTKYASKKYSLCRLTFLLSIFGLCSLLFFNSPFNNISFLFQVFKQPRITPPELWDYDAVYEFVSNVGVGDVWRNYARKLRDDLIDGSTLLSLGVDDLNKEYSMHTPHATALVRKLLSVTESSTNNFNQKPGTMRRLHDIVTKLAIPPEEIPKSTRSEQPRISVVVISQDEQDMMDQLASAADKINDAVLDLGNMEEEVREMTVQRTEEVKEKVEQLVGQLRGRSITLIDDIVLNAEDKLKRFNDQKKNLKEVQQKYTMTIEEVNELIQTYTGFGKSNNHRKQIRDLVEPLLSNIPVTQLVEFIDQPIVLDTSVLEREIELFGIINPMENEI